MRWTRIDGMSTFRERSIYAASVPGAVQGKVSSTMSRVFNGVIALANAREMG